MNPTWIATRALVGGAVLCLAAGAADASGTHGAAARAPVDVVAAGLQAAWGTHAISDAMVVPGSQTIMVATSDTALLHAASAQAFLGTPYPVVLINVAKAGPKAGLSEDACGGAMHDSTRSAPSH